jgi:hypothetical protein
MLKDVTLGQFFPGSSIVPRPGTATVSSATIRASRARPAL